jgi:hypothetical protein
LFPRAVTRARRLEQAPETRQTSPFADGRVAVFSRLHIHRLRYVHIFYAFWYQLVDCLKSLR